MYRLRGSKAYAHGCYIRPGEYVELWREVKYQARTLNISVSEFVSHSMHLFMTGTVAKYSKLKKNERRKKVA